MIFILELNRCIKSCILASLVLLEMYCIFRCATAFLAPTYIWFLSRELARGGWSSKAMSAYLRSVTALGAGTSDNRTIARILLGKPVLNPTGKLGYFDYLPQHKCPSSPSPSVALQRRLVGGSVDSTCHLTCISRILGHIEISPFTNHVTYLHAAHSTEASVIRKWHRNLNPFSSSKP